RSGAARRRDAHPHPQDLHRRRVVLRQGRAARLRASPRHQAQRRPPAQRMGADRVRVAGHRLDRSRRAHAPELRQRPRRSAAGPHRGAEAAVKRLALLCLAAALPLAAQESFHRAEQDREIRYWLLDPATHQFRISHDFTVTRAGQASVHSFVRKGSVVSPDAKMIDLDTGKDLHTHTVSGKEVNALGYYPTPADPESVVVQGDLETPVAAGRTTRVRVQETYT